MQSETRSAFNGSAVGRWISGPPVTVEPMTVAAYAAATGETDRRFTDGEIAPLMFGVVPSWQLAADASRAAVPADLFPRGVHGEHVIAGARPLQAGEILSSRAAPVSIQPVRSGTLVVVRVETRDADGRLVVLQHSSGLFLGAPASQAYGQPRRAANGAVAAAGANGAGETSADLFVPLGRPADYAWASGDRSAIHLDEDAARAIGLPGVILHGMCSLAMAGQALVQTFAGGDGTQLRKLACRFSSPVLPGTTMTVIGWPSPAAGRASRTVKRRLVSSASFRALDDRATSVITHGSAECGPASDELEDE